MNKKLLGILLSLVLTLALIAIPVFAEPDGSGDQAGGETEITTETPSDNETGDTGENNENTDPENKDQDENQNQGDGNDDSNTSGTDNPGDNTGNEEPGDNPGDQPGDDPSEDPTDVEQEDEWIPSLTKPESYNKCEEALIIREVGTDELVIHDGDELSGKEVAKVASGDLDVWHGYKYTETKETVSPDPEPGTEPGDEPGDNPGDDPSDQPGGEPGVNPGDDPGDNPGEGSEDPETPEEPAKKIEIKYGSSASSLIDELGMGVSNIVVKLQKEGSDEEESKNIEVTVAKGDQKISVSKSSYTAAIGSGTFSLGAKSNDSGAALTYSSSDQSSVAVDSKGNVTVNKLPTKAVTITINASETEHYNAASTKVTVNVTSPKAPTLTVKAIGKKKIQLNWSSVPGAVKYQVQPKLGSKKLKANNNVTATTIKNTKLKKGKTYSYQVRAVVTVNGKTYYSPWSAVKKAKVK